MFQYILSYFLVYLVTYWSAIASLDKDRRKLFKRFDPLLIALAGNIDVKFQTCTLGGFVAYIQRTDG